jgi:uncharacterized protein (DUF2252 family)
MATAVAPPRTAAAPEERAARGKAARTGAPRSSHADWEPAHDRPRAIDMMRDEDAGRLPDLVPIRHGRMLQSPFAYFRGSAAVMAADLAGTPDSGVRAQLCGDAHLANFGAFASPDRRIVFDVNDFDETASGPWEWDVKRLAASFAVAGRDRGFAAADRDRVTRRAVRAYRQAMREFAGMRTLDVWYARLDLDELLLRPPADLDPARHKAFARNLEKARAKTSLRAMQTLTRVVDGVPRIVADPPLVVPVEDLAENVADPGELRRELERLLRTYRRSLPADRRRLLDEYRFVHLARKVVGVGSVGTRCWIVLLAGRDENDPLFLQVKEAGPSAIEPYAGSAGYDHHGRRVVEGQRLMQAASDILLGWLRGTGIDGRERDFYVRQLWDGKRSADIDTMDPRTMAVYAGACGWTLARAHARSGDRIAIAGYLGRSSVFDQALAAFAELYADQVDSDHAELVDAVRRGEIDVEEG